MGRNAVADGCGRSNAYVRDWVDGGSLARRCGTRGELMMFGLVIESAADEHRSQGPPFAKHGEW